MKLKDRRRGADILRKVKPLEKKAFINMKNALEEWETP